MAIRITMAPSPSLISSLSLRILVKLIRRMPPSLNPPRPHLRYLKESAAKSDQKSITDVTISSALAGLLSLASGLNESLTEITQHPNRFDGDSDFIPALKSKIIRRHDPRPRQQKHPVRECLITKQV